MLSFGLDFHASNVPSRLRAEHISSTTAIKTKTNNSINFHPAIGNMGREIYMYTGQVITINMDISASGKS